MPKCHLYNKLKKLWTSYNYCAGFIIDSLIFTYVVFLLTVFIKCVYGAFLKISRGTQTFHFPGIWLIVVRCGHGPISQSTKRLIIPLFCWFMMFLRSSLTEMRGRLINGVCNRIISGNWTLLLLLSLFWQTTELSPN